MSNKRCVMKYTHRIKLPYLLYSLKSRELLPGITRGVPTHVETRTCRRNRALKKTFIKAATKVFKRKKKISMAGEKRRDCETRGRQSTDAPNMCDVHP